MYSYIAIQLGLLPDRLSWSFYFVFFLIIYNATALYQFIVNINWPIKDYIHTCIIYMYDTYNIYTYVSSDEFQNLTSKWHPHNVPYLSKSYIIYVYAYEIYMFHDTCKIACIQCMHTCIQSKGLAWSRWTRKLIKFRKFL